MFVCVRELHLLWPARGDLERVRVHDILPALQGIDNFSNYLFYLSHDFPAVLLKKKKSHKMNL